MKSATSVTIDQLHLKEHVRWAQDQQALDPSYVTEAHLVAPHPEFLGMSIIYPSKFDELFELQKKNLPWAFFDPPRNFQAFSKRFFSYRLFPNIYWDEKDESSEEEEEKPSSDLVELVIKLKKLGNQTHSLFEKDKTAVLQLLEEIKWINQLLKQINARKLQYQKG
jgi:hypothetical protein